MNHSFQLRRVWLVSSLACVLVVSTPLLGGPSQLWAQDDDDGDVRELEEKPSVELSEENPSVEPIDVLGDAAEPPTPPIGEKKTPLDYRLFGYLRLESVFVQDDKTTFVGRNDGFRLQNARIGIEADYTSKNTSNHTGTKRFTVRFSADGARDERASVNSVEGTLRFELADAYADVHLTEKIDLRLARFRPVFDIERETSPARRGFARRALSSNGVAPTEGFERAGLAVKRNLGVALRSTDLVRSQGLSAGFEFAIQNGNGENAAQNDNDSFAYSGAVFATVSKVLLATAAARYNRRNEGELPFRRTEDDVEIAASVRLDRAPIRATAQVLARQSRFPTTGQAKQNAYGIHGEALVTIPGLDWLEAGYRYSVLDVSDLDPSDRVQEHTVGANILWPAIHGRFQLNATHVVEQAGMALDNSRLEAVVQVSL